MIVSFAQHMERTSWNAGMTINFKLLLSGMPQRYEQRHIRVTRAGPHPFVVPDFSETETSETALSAGPHFSVVPGLKDSMTGSRTTGLCGAGVETALHSFVASHSLHFISIVMTSSHLGVGGTLTRTMDTTSGNDLGKGAPDSCWDEVGIPREQHPPGQYQTDTHADSGRVLRMLLRDTLTPVHHALHGSLKVQLHGSCMDFSVQDGYTLSPCHLQGKEPEQVLSLLDVRAEGGTGRTKNEMGKNVPVYVVWYHSLTLPSRKERPGTGVLWS